MIKIKKQLSKKTKVHITYEFDLNGAVQERTMTMSIKLYKGLTEREIWHRVRGQVLLERQKKALDDDDKIDGGSRTSAKEKEQADEVREEGSIHEGLGQQSPLEEKPKESSKDKLEE